MSRSEAAKQAQFRYRQKLLKERKDAGWREALLWIRPEDAEAIAAIQGQQSFNQVIQDVFRRGLKSQEPRDPESAPIPTGGVSEKAKTRVTKAVEAEKKRLQKAYEAKEKELCDKFWELVSARVEEQLKEKKEMYDGLVTEIMDEKLRYEIMIQNHRTIISYEEFKYIRGCLHPDKSQDPKEQERLNRAFTLFNQLEPLINKKLPRERLREKNTVDLRKAAGVGL